MYQGSEQVQSVMGRSNINELQLSKWRFGHNMTEVHHAEQCPTGVQSVTNGGYPWGLCGSGVITVRNGSVLTE